ncbi:hypothetical protein OG871_39785 (plasmid) [Kitasatospora sp. NBC_00374]|uniref:hypothetical protein n=1 Tax=Kitasatospora sp. NBC_00374 TaxID=2975964 RepID=UPI002F914909
MHHEDPPRRLPAPCHDAKDPDGGTFLVPGCAGRANDPDNVSACTCVDFKDAALALIAKQDAELREKSRQYLGVCDDYAKLAARCRKLEAELAAANTALASSPSAVRPGGRAAKAARTPTRPTRS